MGFLDFLPIVGNVLDFASAITGAGTAAKSYSSANKTNMAINDANIQNAKEMQATANDFTERMWNQTNAYNDPSAQAARFRAAGMNPYFAMSGQGSSTATTVSGASGSTPSMIPQQPFDSSKYTREIGRSIMGTLASLQYFDKKESRAADTKLKLSQANLMDSQALGQGISNNWADQMNAQGIKELMARIGLLDAQAYGQRQSNYFGQQTHDYYMHELEDNARMRAISEQKLRLELDIAKGELPRIEKRHRMEMAQIAQAMEESKAREDDFRASGKLKLAQKETEVQKEISQRLDNYLKNYTPEQRKKIREAVVERYDSEKYGNGLTGAGAMLGKGFFPKLESWHNSAMERGRAHAKFLRERYEEASRKAKERRSSWRAVSH